MTSEQRDVVLRQHVKSAPHDLGQYREINTLLRKASDRERSDWGSTHRPHIVNRVERRNAAIVERVVDYRREEVERLNDREVVAETVNSCIVGRVEADNQIRVVWLFR